MAPTTVNAIFNPFTAPVNIDIKAPITVSTPRTFSTNDNTYPF